MKREREGWRKGRERWFGCEDEVGLCGGVHLFIHEMDGWDGYGAEG